MKKIILVNIFFLTSGLVHAQTNRIWATYYGGLLHEHSFRNSAIDASGNIYLVGYTQSTTGIASGGFQNTFGGGSIDAYLVKFDSAGNRIWATYYGGTDDDYGLCVATDNLNNVYLGGTTRSISSIASGGFQNNFGGVFDAFIVKFDSAGNRIWASYYGGSVDDHGYSLETDSLNYVYLTGYTQSINGIASGGFQNTFGGFYDSYLVKFDPITGNRIWGTYYGGIGDDRSHYVTTDVLNNVYISGYTVSTSSIAWNGFQNTLSGTQDAFLVKFDSAGNRIWATYYGGSAGEIGYSVAVDPEYNVYLAGLTFSSDSIASNGFQNIPGGGQDAFLVKFNSVGNRLWSTYYGGFSSDIAFSVATDQSGNVYLAGVSMNDTVMAYNGFQNNLIPQRDCFVSKFDSAGNRICATYYGGGPGSNSFADDVGYVSIDKDGFVYLSGFTPFAGLAYNGFQNVCAGGNDAFLVKFKSCLPSLSVNASSTDLLCYGQCTGTAIANPLTGNPPFTYLWSNSQTTQNIFGLCAGIYSVTITDSDGAIGNAVITINQPTQLTDTLSSAATDVSCVGSANIVVSGGTPPYQYQWSNSGTTATINNLCSGWYYVTVTDANDCQITDSVFVNFIDAVNEINSQTFFITSNPATNELTIENSELKIKEIEIYSSIGEKVFSQISNLTSQISIDVSQLPPGIYFVTVTDQAGNKVTKKIVKM